MSALRETLKSVRDIPHMLKVLFCLLCSCKFLDILFLLQSKTVVSKVK
jgi:hypothetical protein